MATKTATKIDDNTVEITQTNKSKYQIKKDQLDTIETKAQERLDEIKSWKALLEK